jgi:hypothetical protein
MTERDETARELLKAHRTVAALRERNNTLEHALRTALAALAPLTATKKPVRRQIGTSDSGGDARKASRGSRTVKPAAGRPSNSDEKFRTVIQRELSPVADEGGEDTHPPRILKKRAIRVADPQGTGYGSRNVTQ